MNGWKWDLQRNDGEGQRRGLDQNRGAEGQGKERSRQLSAKSSLRTPDGVEALRLLDSPSFFG